MKGWHRGLTFSLFVSVAVLVGIIYSGPIAKDQYGDFEVHLGAAREMAATHRIVVPHFFFHLLTLATSSAFRSALKPTAFALATCAESLTCLLLLGLLRYGRATLRLSAEINTPVALLAGFALSFVGPLSLFSYPNLCLGFPGISTAHSPTMVLLRPFALALFIITLRLLDAESRGRWLRLAAGAVILVVLGGLTKPSYNVCLAPALAFVLFLRFRREGSVSKPGLATFALIAGSIALVTLWQFRFTFGEGSEASVEFAPLKVMAVWNNQDRLVTVFRLGLGLVFPLFVTLAYGKARSIRSEALSLSWFATLMAIGSGYVLAETGRRAVHGNLLWSMQICLLVLMTVTLSVFVSEEEWFRKGDPASVSWKTVLGTVLFLLHFFSGLLYIVLTPRAS